MSAYNGLPNDVLQGLRRQTLAGISAPNSIAARSDPNQPGSILSRKYPGMFGQFGASNPQYQEAARRYQRPAQPFDFHTPGVEQAYGLRRPGAQMGINPLYAQMLMQTMYGGQPQQSSGNDNEESDNGYGY